MHLKPAEYAVHAFGGVRPLARAIGKDPSTISRWKRPRSHPGGGCGGKIPTAAQQKLLEIARSMGLDLTESDIIWGRALSQAGNV